MRILIAPNAFKGTLTARRAAAAAAAGVRSALPRAAVDALAIADGGDGLLDALRPALGGRLVRTAVDGPLGEPVKARWLLAGRTAVIEMAEASGLKYMNGRGLRPMDATTRGVGQLMAEAVRLGATEIVVGLGGSASNDGGAGCAEGFGFRLLGRDGRPVRPGAGGLVSLAAVLPGTGAARLRGVKVYGLADVKNRLFGPLGSARVFGPQKGAGPREVRLIDEGLRNYAAVLKAWPGRDVARLEGGAAAGGLGAGLAAFFGAELLDGSAYVLERAGFGRLLRRAGLLITGEGRFDRQTFYGKAPGAAIAAARALGVPAVVVCGSSLIKDRRTLSRLGVAGVIEAGMEPSPAAALRRAVAAGLPAILAGLGRRA